MLTVLIALSTAFADGPLSVDKTGESATSCSYSFNQNDVDAYFDFWGESCDDFNVESWAFVYPASDFMCDNPDFTSPSTSWSKSAPMEGICGAGPGATQCPAAYVYYSCDAPPPPPPSEPDCEMELVDTWKHYRYFDHDGDGWGGEQSGWYWNWEYDDGCGNGYTDKVWTWAGNASAAEQDAYWDGDLPSIDQGGDCDDSNPGIYPGASEICDGLDNNCIAGADEGLKDHYWHDGDDDGKGDADAGSLYSCDPPDGYVSNNDDECDDLPGVYDKEDYWPDGDGDGKGNANADALHDCDPGDGYVTNDGDDCDSVAGVYSKKSYWPDDDGDGKGDENASPVKACTAPASHVINTADCDDADSQVWQKVWYAEDWDGDGIASCENNGAWYCGPQSDPDLHQQCGEDCDPYDPEVGVVMWGYDADGDGYGDWADSVKQCDPAGRGYVDNVSDCDDTDPNANPDTVWYIDRDGDGYGGEEFGNACIPDANGDGVPDVDFVYQGCGDEGDERADDPEYGLRSLMLPRLYLPWSICPTSTANLVPVGGDCNDSNADIYPGHNDHLCIYGLVDLLPLDLQIPDYTLTTLQCEAAVEHTTDSDVYQRLLDPTGHLGRDEASCIDDLFIDGAVLLLQVPVDPAVFPR